MILHLTSLEFFIMSKSLIDVTAGNIKTNKRCLYTICHKKIWTLQ